MSREADRVLFEFMRTTTGDCVEGFSLIGEPGGGYHVEVHLGDTATRSMAERFVAEDREEL